MMRKFKLKTVGSVLVMFFQAMPFQTCFAFLLSLVFMFYQIYTVKVTAGLFESVASWDRVNGTGFESVIKFAVLFVALKLLQSILVILSGVNVNVFLYRKGTDYFRQKLARKAASLPLICFEDPHINDMLARAQNVVKDEQLSEQFDTVQDIMSSSFSLIGIALVLAGYNPWLLFLAIPSVLPFFIMRMIRGKKFYKMKYFQAKAMRGMDYYWQLLFDKSSRKEINVYQFGGYIKEKWRGYSDEVDEQTWTFKRKDSAAFTWMNSFSTIGYLVSIILSVYLLWMGQIGVGVLGACLSAFLSMQTQTQKFLRYLGNIHEAAQFAGDYLDFLNLPKALDGTVELSHGPKMLELKNVSFKYPNGQDDAIRDVNLKINAGERVVLVGENGSGKTTLVKLILGLYECTRGEVLIDGFQMNEIRKESLYDRTSIMMQNALQYKATVREAVAFADECKNQHNDVLSSEQEISVADLKILEALKAAKIDYILDRDGLDMRLGKEFGGRELSGGEWQKLALARALYKDSDFMMLDEPTSAIDPLAEMVILNKFLESCQGKTAIIVSHRVGICTCADKVVVMQKGRVIESGSHKELMEQGGVYHDMYTAQAQYYRD